MTETTKTKTQKRSWRDRPEYPETGEVEGLIRKLQTKTATVADVSRAVTILRKAWIRCDRKTVSEIKAAMVS